MKAGYNVSTPIQMENIFETMERAFRSTVGHNAKTGRERKLCSFQSHVLLITIC